MGVTQSSTGIHLSGVPEGTLSVDVRFDGERVWSVDVRELAAGGEVFLPWPQALAAYLSGRTEASVVDSASGDELGSAELVFGESSERVRVADDEGRPLVLNKWGRLGRSLSSLESSLQRRIVAQAETVVAQLREMGLRPFAVGGTLLGGVREGRLLPHDDDADIAYLSEHTSPADVAREGLRVARRLEALGHELQSHSAAHAQLFFRDDDGEIAFYIDVFSAFFTDDGHVNQPFHVRGEMREDQMLPFGTVEIDGAEFPAPADPDRWLTINFDENWRTPIPGFALVTPEPTRRRFDAWFGAFNFQREFWADYFSGGGGGEPWSLGRAWLREQAETFDAPTVVDIGCGSGELARELALARPGRRVIGLDYSTRAIERARVTAGDLVAAGRVELGDTNLYRLRALGLTAAHGIDGPFDVVLNHVLEQAGHRAREQAWRIMRMALRSGGRACFTFFAQHAVDVRGDDPTGWHLQPDALRDEAAAHGLELRLVRLRGADLADRRRRPYGAVARLAPAAETPEPLTHTGGATMRQRVARAVRSALQTGGDEGASEALARVDRLEHELDEVRRDTLRVAELIDLAEEYLTPSPEGAERSEPAPG